MTRIDGSNAPAPLPTDEEFVGPLPPTCTSSPAQSAGASGASSVSETSPQTDAWEEPSKPSLFERAKSAATGGLERARNALGDPGSLTREAFAPVVDFFEPSPSTTEAISKARQAVEETVTRVTENLDPETLEKTAQTLAENPELFVQAIESSIDQAQATVDAARSLGKDALSTFATTVEQRFDDKVDEAKTNLKEVQTNINDAAKTLGQAHDAISDAIDQKIDQEITEAKTAIKEGIKEGVQDAVAAYKSYELVNRVVDSAIVGVASMAGDAVSNAVVGIVTGVGETIVKEREAYEDALGHLEAAHDWATGPVNLSDDSLAQIAAKLIVGDSRVAFAASVVLDALEVAPDAAEALLKAAKALPSKENFNAMLDDIRPGETREISGELLAKLSIGFGASVSSSRTIEITRDAKNPNFIEITFKDADAGALVLGKSVQGQGASLDVGLKRTDSATLRFDTREPAQLNRARMSTTAAFFSVDPDTLANVFKDHYVATRQELATSISGSASLLTLPLGIDIGSTTTVAHEHRRDNDTSIHRFEMGIKPELSLGKDLFQLPPEVFASLSQNAPDAVSGTLAEIFASQTGGQVGLKAGLSAEATMAVEFHNITPQTLEVDLKLTGDLAGPEHELHLKVTLHDLPELAKALDRTPDDLARALNEGSTTLAELFNIVGKPAEHLEVKITRSSTQFEGTKIDMMGLKLSNGTRQKTEEVWSHFGAREPAAEAELAPFRAALHHDISI
ncbi:hypothetical protein EA187_18325 [Lujinxingia sediminis]|uniref:Uncharacterized protein n=1 Tax=Lujinxingia sediminis TaxID=2480984 RepID=A0ABY0CPQ2_9DELT|nr:hypothetical protein [Lujinxingia sediminis]RVU41615.1 hypothetical protein EA187_18325 [Lujinxingia sediminis]